MTIAVFWKRRATNAALAIEIAHPQGEPAGFQALGSISDIGAMGEGPSLSSAKEQPLLASGRAERISIKSKAPKIISR